MAPHLGHYLVVDIADEVLGLPLQTLSRIFDRAAHPLAGVGRGRRAAMIFAHGDSLSFCGTRTRSLSRPSIARPCDYPAVALRYAIARTSLGTRSGYRSNRALTHRSHRQTYTDIPPRSYYGVNTVRPAKMRVRDRGLPVNFGHANAVDSGIIGSRSTDF